MASFWSHRFPGDAAHREECLVYLFMDDTDAVLAANDTGEPPAEFFVQLSAALKGRKLTKVSTV